MMAVRSAVAPVAQALATLYTGIPVWPICFWSCCPISAFAAIRFPAASTPISAMLTPASASAPVAAWAARSTVSRSGCLPNLVMRMPSIQISSLALIGIAPSSTGDDRSFGGLEAEANRFGALGVGADGVGGEPNLHAIADVLGIRLDVDEVGPHPGTVRAVDHGSNERGRDPRRGEGDDRERAHGALGRDRNGGELGREATGARVAPVEEPSLAIGAFL